MRVMLGVELKKTEKLPMATKVDAIQKGIVLRIEEDGAYFIDDVQVGEQQLASGLVEAKARHQADLPEGQSPNLLVQGDNQMDYEALSPVMRAGAAAGLHQFKFAVIEQSGKN
jgi:biopolymer transport protein ExbD